MRHVLFLLLLAAVVYGYGLGHAGLWDIDESIYADISRNMAESGDWVFPVFNGAPRFDKPPLLFWIGAAAMSVLGPAELAVRFGTYLFALLGVALTYAFGRRLYSHRAGLLGAAVLASTLGWFIAGRIGLLDTGLSFFIGLCVYQLIAIKKGDAAELSPPQSNETSRMPSDFQAPRMPDRQYMPYVWLGLAAALGVLTKGPVTLVLVGGTAIFYFGPKRFFERFLQGRSFIYSLYGLFLFVIVSLPWHLAIYRRAGDAWWQDYFGYHMFSRFTQPLEEHGYGWYFYLIVLAAGFLPWSGHACAALWHAVKRAFLRRQTITAKGDGLDDRLDPPSDAGSDGHRLMALWFFVVLIFFSVSRTKLPGYILPAFLPLAVLAGAWCDHILKQIDAARILKKGLWASLAAGLFVVIVLIAIRSVVPEGYETAHRLLFVFPITLIVGMLITYGWYVMKRAAHALLFGAVGTAFVAMILFTAVLSPLIEEHKPVKPLIKAALPHMTEDTIFISAFGDASSNYYLGRPVIYVHSASRVRQHLKEAPSALALIPETMLSSMGNVHVIASSGPGVLVKNN